MMHGLADSAQHGQDGVRSAFALRLASTSWPPLRLRGVTTLMPQLSRYALVSAFALGLDFTLYLALTAVGVWPPLAGVLGYAAGMLLHYLLSVRFVFDVRATDKAHTRLFGEFAITGVGGMAATAIVIAAATDLGGLSALPAKMLAAGVSFLAVFALRRTVVFAKGDAARSAVGGHSRP